MPDSMVSQNSCSQIIPAKTHRLDYDNLTITTLPHIFVILLVTQ